MLSLLENVVVNNWNSDTDKLFQVAVNKYHILFDGYIINDSCRYQGYCIIIII